ncbi:PAS domain S-box protein [cf. Phormidesmis sp. LEGE 11477]|nr:PAS domain S-box protein [cf. Phormidesmis sp. LEGE 11477]
MIEALILIPSVIRRQQELLQGLALQSSASLKVAMVDVKTTDEVVFPEQLLAKLSRLEAIPIVVGGSLYDVRGNSIGSFGEAPTMTFTDFSDVEDVADSFVSNFNPRADRYEVAQTFPLVGIPHWVVINHDTTSVRREVRAFIWRIFGLVLLISAVVTLTTMVVLRAVLISPVLALNDDLLEAAPAALNEENATMYAFKSLRYRHKKDEIGAVIGAFQQMFERISTNIAQRQQAEDRLRESENRFRTLVEQAAESIFVLDEHAKILDINRFALNSLNYERAELIHHNLFEVNPAFTPQDYDVLWRRLQAGNPVTVESIHRRKDGSTYPVEVRANFMVMTGKQQALALVRDISDRKQAEKAQARLAEIGQLAAMIVHEVRNPFTTVYMALSTFQTMDLPPRGKMRLSLAMEESERLKRLLNEILTYSKEQKLVEERIEINDLSKELLRSLQELPAATDKTIQLITQPEPLIVKGDRDKLKQVFINLVTNACEAISPKETVTWQLQRAFGEHVFQPPTSLQSNSTQHVKIQVHNGGDPIPPEVLPKLTQPFISTKADGNGLGLAITKRIVEAHGGSMTIGSSVEKGTTVTVFLPLVIGDPVLEQSR